MNTKQLYTYWGKLSPAWRVAILGTVGARVFLTLWSYIILLVFPIALKNLTLVAEPVVSIFDLQTSTGYVYNRQVNGKTLSFQKFGEMMRDEQTSSLWNITTGRATSGPMTGAQLANAQTSAEDIFPYLDLTPDSHPLLAIWQHFDANWYLSIAQNGYGTVPEDTHFLPVYPALVWITHFLFNNWLIAALVISHLATILLVKVLYEIFTEWGGEAIAQKGVAFFLLFPTAFFLFGAYAEPVFILTTLLALQQMNKRNWAAAGFWSALTILGRLQGLTIFLSLAYTLWQSFHRKINPNHIKALGLPGLAVLIYGLIRLNAGELSIIPITERANDIRPVWPWENFYNAFSMVSRGENAYITTLNIFFTVLFFCLIIYGWKKIPVEYNLYSLACMLLLVCRGIEAQPLYPMLRYALTLPTAFFVLAEFANNPWRNRLVVFPSITLALFLSAEFFIWSFVS